jgi:hypothetical protein
MALNTVMPSAINKPIMLSVVSPLKFSYSSFQSAVLVHNAGSLGPQGKPVRNSFDVSEMQNYFSTNLVKSIFVI